MGLDSADKLPNGLSMKEAYAKIREWYTEHIPFMYEKLGKRDYSKNSEKLIAHLPMTKQVSDLEAKAILCEILNGNLEWGFHESDGEYKMAAYAVATIDPPKQFVSLTQEEKNKLTSSTIWPYLMCNSR